MDGRRTVKNDGTPRRRFRALRAKIIATAMLAASLPNMPVHAQVACRYEVAAIIQAPPGGFGTNSSTQAAAISPNGRYVVGSYTRPFIVDDPRAFCFDMQTQQFLSLPLITGTYVSHAHDVSDAGIVVGEIGGSGGDWGFLYDLSSGQYTLLSPLASVGICQVIGINSSGTVCGTRTIGGPPNYETSAFIWSAKDGYNDVGLLNNRSTIGKSINSHGVVGVSTGFSINAGSMAYRWDGQVVVPFGFVPGGLSSDVATINDNGWALVSGLLQTNPNVYGAFAKVSDSQYISLAPLPGQTQRVITTMTNSGLVGGGSNSRACVWKHGTPVELSTLLTTPTTHDLQRAYVSESGAIMCRTSTNAVVLRPVRGIDGDTDCNNVVDHFDVLEVIQTWGVCAGCDTDLTMDGRVGVADLLTVIINWTKGGAP